MRRAANLGAMARVDEEGRAFKKSQMQMQLWVNRRGDELTKQTLSALPTLSELDPVVQWVSPLEIRKFREYWDAPFLMAIGREDLVKHLKDYWPAGGPHWDALAVARSKDGSYLGPVLVEAKSWPGEMSSRMTASEDSAKRIRPRLQQTREWLGVSETFRSAWEEELYQYANRLAHLRWFLDVLDDEQAWLLNVYFLADPDAATTQPEWDNALADAEGDLGLAGVEVPSSGRAFLKAGAREELLAPGKSAPAP